MVSNIFSNIINSTNIQPIPEKEKEKEDNAITIDNCDELEDDDETIVNTQTRGPRTHSKRKRGKQSIPVKPILEPLDMADIQKIFIDSAPLGNRFRFMFAMFYLTGARVGELKKLRKNDVQIGERFILIKIPTEKNPHQQYREMLIKKEDFPAMTELILKQLNLMEGHDFILYDSSRINLTTRKLHNNYFLRKLRKLKPIETYGWYKKERMLIVKKWYPHFLRHCRLTHLVKHYGATADQLKYFAGWSSYEPAKAYIKLDWRAIADMIDQKKIPATY